MSPIPETRVGQVDDDLQCQVLVQDGREFFSISWPLQNQWGEILHGWRERESINNFNGENS